MFQQLYQSISWGNCCLLLCVSCDFFYFSFHCLHFYCCFVKYHSLGRCVGGGILVSGGDDSGAWGSNRSGN